MPTQTFFKLSKEKQLKILHAAKKEFSRVPLSKVLVTNISKEAEISRGSFYQYFENVDDLFIYLVKYMYSADAKRLKQYYLECNDIYESFEKKFVQQLNKADNKMNLQFNANIVLSLVNRPEKDCFNLFITMVEVKELIDNSYLKDVFELYPYLNRFMNLIYIEAQSYVCCYISNGCPKEVAISKFHETMMFVKSCIEKLQK